MRQRLVRDPYGPYGSRSDTQRGPYGVDTTVTDASGEGWS